MYGAFPKAHHIGYEVIDRFQKTLLSDRASVFAMYLSPTSRFILPFLGPRHARFFFSDLPLPSPSIPPLARVTFADFHDSVF